MKKSGCDNRLGMIVDKGHPPLRRDLGQLRPLGHITTNRAGEIWIPIFSKSSFAIRSSPHVGAQSHLRSTFGRRLELPAYRSAETSTSKRVGILVGANGSTCRASRPSVPNAIRRISPA